MKQARHFVLGLALLSLAGIAAAQSNASSAPAAGSKDPFVERRDEAAQAKKAYKAKKISKQEYNKEKKQAKDKLKATGVRSDTEKNQDVPQPSK